MVSSCRSLLSHSDRLFEPMALVDISMRSTCWVAPRQLGIESNNCSINCCGAANKSLHADIPCRSGIPRPSCGKRQLIRVGTLLCQKTEPGNSFLSERLLQLQTGVKAVIEARSTKLQRNLQIPCLGKGIGSLANRPHFECTGRS